MAKTLGETRRRSKGKPIRVLAVDDEDIVRSVMEAALETYDDLQVVGTAANGEEALRLCDEHQPDVVVMDVKMPVMDGITCARLIRQRHPETRVIMLSTFREPELVKQASDAGVSEYLFKSISADDLVDSIRSAGKRQPA